MVHNLTPEELNRLADECESAVEYQNFSGMRALLRTVAAIARRVAAIPIKSE